MIKLNYSKLHQGVIWWTIRSNVKILKFYLNCSLRNSDDVKNSHPILCTMALGTSTLCQLRVFYLQKRKVYYTTQGTTICQEKQLFRPCK